MQITNEKIEVTYQMMQNSNMTRWNQLGIPANPKDKSKGLVWKGIMEMEEGDFDKIEEYFLLKRNGE